MTPASRRTVLRLGAAAAGGALAWTVAPSAMADPSPELTGARALDRIGLGDEASESAHGLIATRSTSTTGALSQPSRVLLAPESSGFWGGSIAFTMAVDPTRTTYFSLKLWGEDWAPLVNEWRLQLFADGKIVGWLDQGPVDNLDHLGAAPRLPGQFRIHTLPLPENLTAGRTELDLEVRAMGRIWAYGGTASAFYKDMTTDSRPVYAVYTHTDPAFTPEADDEFGTPVAATSRPDDSAEAIEAVRARVLSDQNALLYATPSTAIDPWARMTLVNGYSWADGPAYRSERALTKVCEAIDAHYLAWKADPKVLTASGQQWQGFGRVALALDTLWNDLGDRLDATVTQGSTEVPNPGFEAGTAGWTTTTWRGSGTVGADTSTAASGTQSLKVVAAPNGTAGSVVGVTLTSKYRPIIGDGTYRVSVQCRTAEVSGAGAYLDVLYYAADGTLVKGDTKTFAATGTHDWEEVAAMLRTPSGASRMRIDLRLEGTGTAWFDDVSLELVDGEPPSAEGLPERREAYAEMLLASREYWRQNQRHYTNQVQFTSLGVYLCNKGLSLLGSPEAWPESTAREWVYEAVGLSPLTCGELEDGTKKWKLGHDYLLYTPKGLSRELGYVGGYGEITADLLTSLYEAVTTGATSVEDAALREQIEKLLETRGWFRHEGVDTDGNRVMRLEAVIGWRNEHYPGEADYAVPVDKDINPWLCQLHLAPEWRSDLAPPDARSATERWLRSESRTMAPPTVRPHHSMST